MDGSARLLAGAVRLLPASRRHWGGAMVAELACIGARRERWQFALGCCRAVVSRPAVLARACGCGAATAAVVLAAGIGFAAGRDGMLLMLALLAATRWLVRRPARFRHVGLSPAAQAVLTGGYAVVAAKAFLEIQGLRHVPLGYVDAGRTNTLTVVWTVTLMVCLAATVRVTGCGSPAVPATLTIGAGTGGAAAAAWLAATVLHPAVPGSSGPAVIVIAGAAAIGWLLVGRSGQGRIAGLLAGASAALLIGLMIDGPLPALPWWVRDNTAPLDAAGFARLVDPIGIWALGVLLAAALAVAVRSPARTRAGVLLG
ncbi:MAG TPA: hypothetical protein VF109_01225 [Mycobacteriales bacterium]